MEVRLKNYRSTHTQERKTTLCTCSPVCDVGVRGVGGAPSCVPRGLPEADGMPLAAGFLLCLSLSSRSRLSLSASSAARLAPFVEKINNDDKLRLYKCLNNQPKKKKTNMIQKPYVYYKAVPNRLKEN